MPEPLHVSVDPLICDGTGYCQRVVPDVFAVGDDAKAHVLLENPSEDLRELVEEAATLCPTRAIRY